MGSFASIDGHVTSLSEARVSVMDTGFTFGDSVYETLRTYQGMPHALDQHLDRLRASAGRLGIQVPISDEQLGSRLHELLERADNEESYIRWMVTRGVGDVSYRFERVVGPTVVAIVKPLEPPPPRLYEQGMPVAIVARRRTSPRALDPAIKSCNLLNNLLAVREAQAGGALEAILLNDSGDVAECAGSNVFAVCDRVICTPPLDAGILPGITRALVLELAAQLGLEAREEAMSPDDLHGADEVFITSSLKEVMPVCRIDDRPVGTGTPGVITRQLLDAYRAMANGK